jgi:hypothetical protein
MPLLQSRLSACRGLCTALVFFSSALFGAENRPPSSPTEMVREQVLRMTEFFDTMLPGVLEKHNMTLHFRPKFSDLRDYEYWRFPLELRYGLTERWELRGGFVPFTPNPFNSGRNHNWGLGEARLGGRYDLGPTLGFFDDTTIGIETRIPLGRPPIELNDHYTHLKPFVSAARRLRAWPSTTLYANAAYDRSIDLTHRDPPPVAVVRRNIWELGPGLLYKPGEFGYFTEYRFRHIREDIGWHLGHQVQIGTIWDVPLARTEALRLPGKWQLELAYRFTHEEGRERDHGVSARVSWRTTLREVLDHARTVTASKRP